MFAASKSGRASGGGPTPTDPSFAYVPLLLNTTSTNGQQNNTFLDSSTNNFTITRSGTPTQGSITPYWPNGQWSNYFGDLSSNNLNVSSPGANFQFSGDFTIEGWYWAASGGDSSIFIVGTSTYLAFNINPTGNTFNIYLNSATPTFSPTATIPLSQWNHVALVRSGSGSGNVKVYLNGVALGTTATNTSTLGYASPSIARVGGGTATTGVYVSNLRIAASAVYTSNFTPPTAPLGVISGGQNPPTGTQTKLLTCQSNRFIDNSSNNFTLTLTGTPRVQAFQPFSPTASYTTALYGGSGYFNGSTDYLTSTITAPNSSIVSFECWVYNLVLDGTQGNHYITIGTTNWTFSHNPTGSARFFCKNDAGTTIFDITSASGVLKLNQWQYMVGIRSGSNAALYVDGVRVGTATGLGAVTATQTTLYVSSNQGSGRYTNGYLSNVRIQSGTLPSGYDPTSTTIAVPTTPLAAVTGTLFLGNFTNAGIYDAAAQNVVTTVGDAQVSTTITAQFPPTSMKFDGTGDFISMVDAPVFDFGSSDFTIEAWVYTASSSSQMIYSRETTSLNGILFQVSSGLTLGANLSSNGSAYQLILTGGTITANTWTYVAMTRIGSGTNNIKIFLGATPGGSATQVAQGTFASAIYTTTGMTPVVGARNTNGSTAFNGYIQDLRITRGVGRTISTVPSASFPTR